MEAPTMPPEILRYQRDRPLDAVPAYTVGLQLKLSTGEPVYLALSATELALYFSEPLALHFDLEARLVKLATPDHYWRRSLSHRVVFTRKRAAEEGGGLERLLLSEEEADTLVKDANAPVRRVHDELQAHTAQLESGKPDFETALARLQPLLARAAAFDVPAARRAAAQYVSIYRGVAVLPPNEYNALVLQATEGCAYNQCAFCQLYKGVPYRAKSASEFEEHIDRVVAFHGESLRARRSLFLGEANALTLPQEALVADLKLIGKVFELPAAEEREVSASWWLGHPRRFDGIGSFLDVFTGPRRTGQEWSELRHFGLRRVYIGLETGDDELLKWLRKPATVEAVRRCVSALKGAQLAVAVIVLLGAGGQQRHESHVRETARLLNTLPLGRGDYVYLSPLIIYSGGQYDSLALLDNITPLTPAQIDAQEQAVRAALRVGAHYVSPSVARYDLEAFTY